MKTLFKKAILSILLFPFCIEAAETEADVCVYGGTSGGVVAAVQAARMGKRVVLVEPGGHLGGMTSGGLSAVDIGEPRSVGGIAREYFTRLVANYGKELTWDKPFKRAKNAKGPATGGAYSIEPSVAESVFDEMVAEAGVILLREARLKSVEKDGAKITKLVMEDGRVVQAKMFIDTTYEGDLMAVAGVSYTVMREGNDKYGESLNGIHYTDKYKPRIDHLQPGPSGRTKSGQGAWDRDFPLDPYVVKGDPESGLLPFIDEGEPGTPGDPAPGIQAYCYRLCLTSADDRLPIDPPADYDAKDYEIVARFIAACEAIGDEMDLRWFSKHDPLPNEKWDFNTATFGGNLPGASWEWPEASYDRREEIGKKIENYHRGLFYFLATDPRVPEGVRKDVARFGLPKDEFKDTGGWPHQIYVREGRRMVSDQVMTEHHTFGREVMDRPIGLGSYGTDAHEIRRIVKDGVVTREGKIASGRGGFGPYQIGYGAIVPKEAECENLLVTFALSASHTAFASIRMEPVLMVTSQSAATGACIAIDDGIPVQEVPYEKLEQRLKSDGQVLEWPPKKPIVAKEPDVLFIAIDDMNDWISLLDPESPIKTPNLERLAERGMLFTRAYCASPACNPSRVATLTGLRPTTSGVYGNATDWRGALPDRKTIMQRFQDAGYAVRGAGKIFHHHLNGAFHDEASFDEFQPMAPQNMPASKLNEAPEYGSKNTDWGAWPADEKDTIDFKTVDYCIKTLKNSPMDRPQFLACGIFKPHSPFFAPPKYHAVYADVENPVLLESDWDDLPKGAKALMTKKKWFWEGMKKLDGRIPGSYHDFIQAYAACCTFADAQVGRLLDALDSYPRGKNTVIVLWSDHGFHLGEKDHIEKFAMWEKSNHIPLIVVAPGLTKPGSRCVTPVDLSVLYPTLLDLCGLPSDPVCDGESIVSLLKNPEAEWTKPALMTYGKGNHALRDERWRYIRYADGTEELYDHDSDPNEWTNVAAVPENAKVIARLRPHLPEIEVAAFRNLKKKAYH